MKLRATLIGFTAILMWSFLALFTAASGKMPPFQLSAVCFAIGSIPGLVVLTLNPARLALLKQPAKVWITGISGLFGYHFLYFTALRNAPAVEAGLVAYLWPLLIVVGSALLPGERLRWYHVAGALAGLCGTFLIVGRNGIDFDGAYAIGYGAAVLCAFTWSGYSLLTRRFDAVSTDVVTGFCLATSILSFFCHLGLRRPSGLQRVSSGSPSPDSGSSRLGLPSTPGITASRTAISRSSARQVTQHHCYRH